MQAAIAFLDQLIVDPITVPIMFSYGEIEGQSLASDALGESDTNGAPETYATLVSQLTAAAKTPAMLTAVESLPATDPEGNGAGTFWVSDAEGAAFGVGSEPQFTDPEDGFAALSSSYTFTYDPNNRAVPGEYDAIGTLEHEITEAMGRISDLGMSTYDNTAPGVAEPAYNPLDLFRYSSPGVRDVTPGPGYFSLDGQTLLQQYNDPTNGGDAGDWVDSLMGDSFGAGYAGVAALVTPVDIEEMEAIGFQVAAPMPLLDFNGDGNADILWRNTNSGDVYLYDSIPGAGFTGQDIGVVDNSWVIQGVGDFNGDGKADILWRNTVSGDVYLYDSIPGAGSTGFTGQDIGVVDSSWVIQGVGDFNGDGRADILWRNTNSGDVYLYDSIPGSGFTGFTGQDVGVVGSDWTIVGEKPPALGGATGVGPSAALLAQAAAALVHQSGTASAATQTTASQPPTALALSVPSNQG